MMRKDVVTRSASETRKLSRDVAMEILRHSSRKHATVVALVGELGAGKTTFAAAFVRALGIKTRIQSPTFVLIKTYSVPHVRGKQLVICDKRRSSHAACYSLHATRLVHIDCYRLERPAELMHLGLRETLRDPNAVILIEWAERIRQVLPKGTVWINFMYGNRKNERIITIHEKTRHS